jgi:predicted DNA-binding antitoxin AbrB/MazE fold protein
MIYAMVSNGEISVTYADGVLKPDRRLNFPEGTRLRAVIRPEAPDPAAAAQAMETIRRIRESGVFRSGGRKYTRDEMHERD